MLDRRARRQRQYKGQAKIFSAEKVHGAMVMFVSVVNTHTKSRWQYNFHFSCALPANMMLSNRFSR
jgi:hypothetical protein